MALKRLPFVHRYPINMLEIVASPALPLRRVDLSRSQIGQRDGRGAPSIVAYFLSLAKVSRTLQM